MFEKPNDMELRDLARLGSEEFRHGRQYLERELATTKDKLVSATGDGFLQLQGRAKLITELLKEVAHARSK